MIEKAPSDPAVAVPSEIFPLNNVTVLPTSAVPAITGVLILVNAVSVVITGASGAVVSIVNASAVDADEVFPAASVAVDVKE